MWLLLFVAQIATLAVLAAAGSITAAVPALRYLGWACAAGIFLSIPPLVVKAFVAAQIRIGNGDVALVRGLSQHEVAVVLGVWLMIAAALWMALPQIQKDIREEQAAAAIGNGDALATDTLAYTVAGSERRPEVHVATPSADSPQYAAIIDALRPRLKSGGSFRVDHIRVASNWAFVRATETVATAGGAAHATDNSIAALLELPAASTSGWWRIAELWTSVSDSTAPIGDFTPRVKRRLRAEGLPVSMLPNDP